MKKARCTSFGGYSTNKSTAYSPTGAKFEQQYLIHKHMMNHYSFIDRAKSSIDNKPPKCIDKFIKARTKNSKFQKFSKADSRQKVLPVKHTAPNEYEYEEIYTDDIENEFLSGLSTKDVNFDDNDSDDPMKSFTEARSHQTTSYKHPREMAKRSSTPKYKIEMYAPEDGPPTLKGSLYTNHSIFRTNRNIKKRQQSELKVDSSHNQSYTDAWKNQSLSLKKQPSHSQFHVTTAWSNGTVSYKEARYSRSVRLDLSTMSLDEQLNHTQLLNKFNNKELPTFEVDRLQKQEELIAEEQLYLQFIEEVTSDILSRGIFSDRVLNQVFDTHLEKRKGMLNEDRMRAMIEELKHDLNVAETVADPKTLKHNKQTKPKIPSNQRESSVRVRRQVSNNEFLNVDEEEEDEIEDLLHSEHSNGLDEDARGLQEQSDDIRYTQSSPTDHLSGYGADSKRVLDDGFSQNNDMVGDVSNPGNNNGYGNDEFGNAGFVGVEDDVGDVESDGGEF